MVIIIPITKTESFSILPFVVISALLFKKAYNLTLFNFCFSFFWLFFFIFAR